MAEGRIGYTGWFERKSPGIFRLTMSGTVGAFVGVLLILLVQQRFQSWLVTGILILLLAVFEVFYGWRYDGKTLARRRAEKRNIRKRAKNGENDYVTGAMAHLEGSYGGHPMPGVLADTEVLHGVDGFGEPFAVIHYRSRGLFAAGFRCYPDGVGTLDQDMVDLMVAKYGAWLATIGPDEGLAGATAIVETYPSTGVRARENVAARRHPDAPEIASQMMDDAVDALPQRSSDLAGYVCLVWKKQAMGVEAGTDEDVVVEIAKRLPFHQNALSATGAGDPDYLLESDLVEIAQLAYNPSLQADVDTMHARGLHAALTWEDAGPEFLGETRERLNHDGGVSFSLEMRRPPRGIVFENHLLRLLSPNTVFLRKRVAIFYQSIAVEKGQSIAEGAVRTEDFTQAQRKGRRTASMQRDSTVAAQLDGDLAAGAALIPFASIATVTYEDTPDAERRARNALRSLMTSSRMRVREMRGLQGPAFHMTLPFGILPWEFTDNPIWN